MSTPIHISLPGSPTVLPTGVDDSMEEGRVWWVKVYPEEVPGGHFALIGARNTNNGGDSIYFGVARENGELEVLGNLCYGKKGE